MKMSYRTVFRLIEGTYVRLDRPARDFARWQQVVAGKQNTNSETPSNLIGALSLIKAGHTNHNRDAVLRYMFGHLSAMVLSAPQEDRRKVCPAECVVQCDWAHY